MEEGAVVADRVIETDDPATWTKRLSNNHLDLFESACRRLGPNDKEEVSRAELRAIVAELRECRRSKRSPLSTIRE